MRGLRRTGGSVVETRDLASLLKFLSDNGPEYRSKPLRRFLAERGMVACRTPIRSPQSNGLMEAYFGWFKPRLAGVNQHPIETLETRQPRLKAGGWSTTTGRPPTAPWE